MSLFINTIDSHTIGLRAKLALSLQAALEEEVGTLHTSGLFVHTEDHTMVKIDS